MSHILKPLLCNVVTIPVTVGHPCQVGDIVNKFGLRVLSESSIFLRFLGDLSYNVLKLTFLSDQPLLEGLIEDCHFFLMYPEVRHITHSCLRVNKAWLKLSMILQNIWRKIAVIVLSIISPSILLSQICFAYEILPNYQAMSISYIFWILMIRTDTYFPKKNWHLIINLCKMHFIINAPF